MTLYHYRAVGKNGVVQKGLLEASSITELKIHVRESGLSLITYSLKRSFIFSKKIKNSILMDFCLHLEQFENAGISLKENLVDLYHTQSTSRLKPVLKEIIKDVEGGLLFSKALDKHSTIFDPVFVGLIAAGEQTGRFSIVLQQLYQHLKWMDEVQAQVFKALCYPLIMSIVLLSVMVVLMTVLVPELVIFMKTFVENMPFSTRLLVSISSFLSNNLYIIFVIILFFSFLLISFFNFYSNGFYWRDRLLDSFPFIGPLRRKIALTRFCHIFAIMFESGVNIIQALQTSRKYLKQGQMDYALHHVERFIKEGDSLSNAFQKVGFFPPIVIQMVKIGEKTSSLHKTLFHVKDYFDATLKRQVDHTISLLEPIMILCLGCLMAWIIYSVFLPLYDTMSTLDY